MIVAGARVCAYVFQECVESNAIFAFGPSGSSNRFSKAAGGSEYCSHCELRNSIFFFLCRVVQNETNDDTVLAKLANAAVSIGKIQCLACALRC